MITKTSRIVSGVAFAVVAAASGLTATMWPGPHASALGSDVALSPSVQRTAQAHWQQVEASAAQQEIGRAVKPVRASVPPPTPTPTHAPPPPPVYTPPPDPGTSQAIAYDMLPSFGFDQGSQYQCLLALWTQESSWNVYATEPTSGAYGIPQALPGYKMASAGADWQTDAATQIRWGLGYIRDVYVTPCGAEQHELVDHWY